MRLTISQLLAGTRIGPGRSPDAARVPGMHCRTRGRRTPSRLTNALEKRPSEDEVGRIVKVLRSAGISFLLPG